MSIRYELRRLNRSSKLFDGASYTLTEYIAESNSMYALLMQIQDIDGSLYASPADQFGRRRIYSKIGRDHYFLTSYYIK